jgi:hypothetical protein
MGINSTLEAQSLFLSALVQFQSIRRDCLFQSLDIKALSHCFQQGLQKPKFSLQVLESLRQIFDLMTELNIVDEN